MFRKCPHRNITDSSNRFLWYFQQSVPCLWASIQSRKKEATSAASAAAPAAHAGAPAFVHAASAPVAVPTPHTNSRPSITAFTFIAQINVQKASVDTTLTSNPMPLCVACHLHFCSLSLLVSFGIFVGFRSVCFRYVCFRFVCIRLLSLAAVPFAFVMLASVLFSSVGC